MATQSDKAAQLAAVAGQGRGAAALRPSEFMRARRPELYSDREDRSEPIVETSRLEFHLDTMTARSEEKQFEHYARQLCQREICPNLRPQTGPTGGGDSKVDSDTFPVSQAIAERWYVGNAEHMGAAELAFAFSAKKAWQAKVRDDVKSIASTGRPYQRIYFVSNQAIPDKKKAQAEDELRKLHRIPVTILDRTWLVERTLNAKNIDLATAALGLGDLERQHRRTTGARDFAREQRHRELQARIADTAQYTAGYQLVEDAIEAALLARGMGWSRADVDGQFERAVRLAARHGGRMQQLRARYLWIWSAYWWFDDTAALRRGLLELEREMGPDASVWELELLVNLQTALAGSVATDPTAPTAQHEAARQRLLDALAYAARDTGAPTQALWARTQLVFLRVLELAASGSFAPVVAELKDILGQAARLPEYPTESLLNWLTATLELSLRDDSLMAIAEDVVEFKSARAGVGARVAARTQLAAAHIERREPYAALEQLGRVQRALMEHNSADDQAWQWALSAAAYELAGLDWACRACLVCAVASGFGQWRRSGTIPSRLRSHVRRLLWAELRLGNVPTAIHWAEMWALLPAPADDAQVEQEHLIALNAAFGVAALRSADEELQQLGLLPELYRAAGLSWAADFALVALGHADDVAAGVQTPVDDVLRTAALLLQQPLAQQLRPRWQWRLGEPIELQARVAGARVRLQVAADRDCLLVAETFLGILEATLSLTVAQALHASRDEITVQVLRDPGGQPGLRCIFAEDECGEEQAQLRVSGSPVTDAVYTEVLTWIAPVVEVAVRLLQFVSEKQLLQLFEPGSVHAARGISLMGLPRMLDNLLGARYPGGASWRGEAGARLAPEARQWPLVRSAPLHEVLPTLDAPPLEHTAADSLLSHADYAMDGLIQVDLWHRSGWRGFGYIVLDEQQPPVLGVMFEDHALGRKIFRGLHKRLGGGSGRGRLVVGALTGIDARQSTHYRAVITTPRQMASGAKVVMLPCLRQTLEPTDSSLREAFEAAVTAHGQFRMAPMMVDFARSPPPPERWQEMFDLSLAIEMDQFVSAQAWTVGLEHPLALGFMRGDQPVVPPGVAAPASAEVLAALEHSSMASSAARSGVASGG